MDVKKTAYLLQKKSSVQFALRAFIGRLVFQNLSDCKYLYLIDSAFVYVTGTEVFENFTSDNSVSFVSLLPQAFPSVHQISGYLMEFQSATLRAQFELDIFNG